MRLQKVAPVPVPSAGLACPRALVLVVGGACPQTEVPTVPPPCACAAVDTGLVEAVGVCNYDTDQLREFHSLMAARGVPVASNQVHQGHFALLSLCITMYT